jgi:hypothetical protein
VAGLTLGGAGYTTEQLIQILSTPPRGSAPYILAHQLIAAKLNVLNGADSSGIATTIANADAWLANVGGLNAWPTGAERQTGIAYASQLDAFNNGLSGVPHCEGGPTPHPLHSDPCHPRVQPRRSSPFAHARGDASLSLLTKPAPASHQDTQSARRNSLIRRPRPWHDQLSPGAP